MPIIEIRDNYEHIGIHSRKPTYGKELDMVNDFINYRISYYQEKPERQLAIFVEPKINNAYPDIIFAEYNPNIYESWVDIRNTLDLFDMKILNCIINHELISSEDIVRELSIKYKGLLFSLEKLYDSKLIYRTNSKWTALKENVIGLLNIECVEAKISKWHEVFQQALLNKSFSSESSVLTKLKGNPRNDICKTFDDFGIGIYLFDDIEFSRLSMPYNNNIPINHNSLYLNEWIGRILNN